MRNLRIKIGKYLLRKRLRQFKRERTGSNFGTAKSVGLIFELSDRESLETIKQFTSYLHEYKLQVYVLGYVNSKKVPEDYFFWKDLNFFSKNELGFWSRIPSSPVVVNFMEKPFDILLDLSKTNAFPLQYITTLSKAKFKIGRFDERNKTSDMMFEIDRLTPLEKYLEYIRNYIFIMN